MDKSSITVIIRGPGRLRILIGSIFVGLGGMMWEFGESIIADGFKVEEVEDDG